MQTFDVQLTDISRGAVIGTDRSVRIGILPSDSSAGVFSVTPRQVTVFTQWIRSIEVKYTCTIML